MAVCKNARKEFIRVQESSPFNSITIFIFLVYYLTETPFSCLLMELIDSITNGVNAMN